MFRTLPAFMLALASTVVLAADRKPPYWASIDTGQAMMRIGPGRNYPAFWLYTRRDLPVRVIKTYPDWRKVRDPDGAEGWILVRLLSDTRTAIVAPGPSRPLHDAPESAGIAYLAAPGVVGRVSKCRSGWCRLDVRGRGGFIRVGNLWGVDPLEIID